MASLCCRYLRKVVIFQLPTSNFSELRGNRIKGVWLAVLSNNTFMKNNHIYELKEILN